MTAPRTAAPDHCSKAGAERLAERIVAYWAERGVRIAARVESVSAPNCALRTPPFYAVRSDLSLTVPR